MRGRTQTLRLLCALRMKYASIFSVYSKSAMTPSFIGLIATMLPGVRPSISLASRPTASTRPFTLLMAMIERLVDDDVAVQVMARSLESEKGNACQTVLLLRRCGDSIVCPSLHLVHGAVGGNRRPDGSPARRHARDPVGGRNCAPRCGRGCARPPSRRRRARSGQHDRELVAAERAPRRFPRAPRITEAASTRAAANTCPYVSLTALNPSRSMNRARAAGAHRRLVSRRSDRFGVPRRVTSRVRSCATAAVSARLSRRRLATAAVVAAPTSGSAITDSGPTGPAAGRPRRSARRRLAACTTRPPIASARRGRRAARQQRQLAVGARRHHAPGRRRQPGRRPVDQQLRDQLRIERLVRERNQIGQRRRGAPGARPGSAVWPEGGRQGRAPWSSGIGGNPRRAVCGALALARQPAGSSVTSLPGTRLLTAAKCFCAVKIYHTTPARPAGGGLV